MIETVTTVLFHWILGFFAVATPIISAYSVGNILRLRQVRLAWNGGRMLGYPVFSSVFLLMMALVTSLAVWQQQTHLYSTVIGLSWIGVNWFVVSVLASRRIITNTGIVKNVNEPAQTVHWTQIVDYSTEERANGVHYTFFYQAVNDKGTLSGSLMRVELFVPGSHVAPFQTLVTRKLSSLAWAETPESNSVKLVDND